MLKPGEMRNEQICGQGWGMRVALVGLVAGNLLLTPVLTEAVMQTVKPGHATKTIVVSAAPQAATNMQPRVSPYAIANKQRVAAQKSQPPAMQLPVRRVNR